MDETTWVGWLALSKSSVKASWSFSVSLVQLSGLCAEACYRSDLAGGADHGGYPATWQALFIFHKLIPIPLCLTWESWYVAVVCNIWTCTAQNCSCSSAFFEQFWAVHLHSNPNSIVFVFVMSEEGHNNCQMVKALGYRSKVFMNKLPCVALLVKINM